MLGCEVIGAARRVDDEAFELVGAAVSDAIPGRFKDGYTIETVEMLSRTTKNAIFILWILTLVPSRSEAKVASNPVFIRIERRIWRRRRHWTVFCLLYTSPSPRDS